MYEKYLRIFGSKICKRCEIIIMSVSHCRGQRKSGKKGQSASQCRGKIINL